MEMASCSGEQVLLFASVQEKAMTTEGSSSIVLPEMTTQPAWSALEVEQAGFFAQTSLVLYLSI